MIDTATKNMTSASVLLDELLVDLRKRINSPVRPVRQKNTQLIEYLTNYITALDNITSVNSFLVEKGASKSTLAEFGYQHSKRKFFFDILGDSFVGEQITEDDIYGQKPALRIKLEHALDFQNLIKYYAIDLDSSLVQHESDIDISDLKNLASNLHIQGFSAFTVHLANKVFAHTGDLKDFNDMKILSKEVQSKIKQVASVSADVNNVKMTISGAYVTLSKVINQMQNKNPPPQTFVLMATKKLIIDTDLSVQNSHLVIVAPVVEVAPGRTWTISMQGDDGGLKIVPLTLSCIQTGLSGNNGFSSRNFNLFALNLKNHLNLNIVTKGGKGGDGENGKTGCNAVKKSEPVTLSIPSEIKLNMATLAVP